MRKNNPKKANELLEMQNKASACIKANELGEAEALLRKIRQAARDEGWGHATPTYQLSFVYFRQDRLEDAFELVLEAIADDPVNPDFYDGYRAVLQQMRETIERKDAVLTDATIGRYYAIIAREGEATVETHLAMLRHLSAMEEKDEAKRLADALLLLYPEHPDVWMYAVSLGVDDRRGIASDPSESAAFILAPKTPVEA